MSRASRAQFEAAFPDDAACLAALMQARHGGTEIWCPACTTRARFHAMRQRRAYACQNCGHHLFPCAETIFARSRTPLRAWFWAMYLMSGARKGVSAKVLERELGVTYKTAWRMARLLRRLMATADYRGALAGLGSGLAFGALTRLATRATP
jgi:transposase-like protein